MNKFLDRHKVAKVSCCYALAENVFAVSQAAYAGEDSVCGAPISGTNVSVEDGEIVISGDSLFDAFLIDGTFIKAPTEYKTGDMGEITQDGQIKIFGRLKEIAKVYGKQIYLPDMDKEVNDNCDVHRGRVASVAIEEDGTEKIVVLYESSDRQGREIKKCISKSFEVSCLTLRVPDGYLIKTSSGKLSRDENK
jgi:acyl-CoA synthetase (AMP-forming)/AMP-acid ligase II